VAHGRDDSESVSRFGHVQIGDDYIKDLISDVFQSFWNGRGSDDHKSFTRERFDS
jgi:hypothetical protein